MRLAAVQALAQGAQFGALDAQLIAVLKDQAFQFLDAVFQLRFSVPDCADQFADDGHAGLMGMNRLEDGLLKAIVRFGKLFTEAVVAIRHSVGAPVDVLLEAQQAFAHGIQFLREIGVMAQQLVIAAFEVMVLALQDVIAALQVIVAPFEVVVAVDHGVDGVHEFAKDAAQPALEGAEGIRQIGFQGVDLDDVFAFNGHD